MDFFVGCFLGLGVFLATYSLVLGSIMLSQHKLYFVYGCVLFIGEKFCVCKGFELITKQYSYISEFYPG